MGVREAVGVWVGVEVRVDVRVSVGVDVRVDVRVGVGVDVRVGVEVIIGINVLVGLGVGLANAGAADVDGASSKNAPSNTNAGTMDRARIASSCAQNV